MADLSNLTYSTLQTAVGDWLARGDLTTNIPDFITLFEAEANRSLRVRQMEVTISTTPTSGVAALPDDYLTWRRLTWTGNPARVLEYMQPDILRIYHPVLGGADLTLNSGIPSMFTIEGNNIILRPINTTALEFDYYQKIPSLATQGSTGANWLLSAHPDCYLAGSMTEAYVFQKDWDQAGIWKQRRDDIMDRMKVLDQKTRGPSYIRPDMRGRIP
jgi:hypothetical protein